ncbi:hypothetical protein FDP08_03830 [Marinobacter panjinensis]|uniref:Glycosyltransferase n=1 Tax=Marinobacter panjinensis TaxID=2576384 RepID=A0A4U6R387_9GAMM|nr:hypothetical protein [Marinobacter panjinensis]MCR8915740.1 hypothetical protein [Marinobacter panjinensis]TKV67278.1 hypothetical protein FDP08_03830 [Marinobacter panjinensis]
MVNQPETRSPGNNYELTVIIAEEMAAVNLQRIFRVLQPESYPRVEFLVCSGSDRSLLCDIPVRANVRIIPAQSDNRIPALWADGIRAAKAEKVALTSAHCIPETDWLDRLLACPLDGIQVAIGGAIENAKNDTRIGRAIYLLRYVRYTGARPSGLAEDLAADNALYRKADILAHEDLLKIGFWEPSFHERFLAEGKSLEFDNQLIVVHHNCYTAKQFIRQRYSHGIEFGAARAKAMTGTKRLMMITLSPLIPVVFTRKIMAYARKDKRFNPGLKRDMGWLLVFILAWSAGETVGYIRK